MVALRTTSIATLPNHSRCQRGLCGHRYEVGVGFIDTGSIPAGSS